ncbi:hypothetical protein CP99DC5_1162A, partial [Chlamydia psittaci 99DC5]
MILSRR